jgi:alpha-tubulin suppressor-like RCC1 family protein
VPGLTGVTAIAAGQATAYALRADGTVWAWGRNQTGQLGDDTTVDSSVPVQVSGLTDATAIAAGWRTAYAVRADGTVWAWGDNSSSQLGLGSTAPYSPVPVMTSAIPGFTSVADGTDGAVLALNEDGTVWSWGQNNAGQLGNGESCTPGVPCVSSSPLRVANLTGVTAIAGGTNNGYAVRGDGSVWAWGWGYRGNLGDGGCDSVSCYARAPVRVSNISDATDVGSFDEGGYALRANGTVVAWGHNYYDSLGNASVIGHSTTPVPVNGLTGVSAVTGAFLSGYALLPNP